MPTPRPLAALLLLAALPVLAAARPAWPVHAAEATSTEDAEAPDEADGAEAPDEAGGAEALDEAGGAEAPDESGGAPAPAAGLFTGRLELEELGRIEWAPKALQGPAKVVKQIAHEGKVRAGDPVLVLVVERTAEQKEQAAMAIAQAEAALEAARADATRQEKTAAIDLEGAMLGATQADEALAHFRRIGREHAEAQAKAELDNATAGLKDSRSELGQLEAMYKDGKVDGLTRELVFTRARHQVAMAELGLRLRAEQTKTSLERDIPRQERQLELAARQAALNLERVRSEAPGQRLARKQAVRRAEWALEKARENANRLGQDLAALTPAAPADGILAIAEFKEKQNVAGPLARVLSPRKARVSVQVPADRRGAYQPGAKVEVEIPELGLKLPGTVARLAQEGRPAGDQKTQFTAQIALCADQDLAAGLVAKVPEKVPEKALAKAPEKKAEPTAEKTK